MICDHQDGFIPTKITTDAMFVSRRSEKVREELQRVFVDVEEDLDRVQKEEVWFCTRMLNWCRRCMRAGCGWGGRCRSDGWRSSMSLDGRKGGAGGEKCRQ